MSRCFAVLAAVGLASCAATPEGLHPDAKVTVPDGSLDAGAKDGGQAVDAAADAAADAPLAWDADLDAGEEDAADGGDGDGGDGGCVVSGLGELCNGIDDNCNGQTDEGYAVGFECTVGQGVCERTGQYRCSANGMGTECNVQPGLSGPELCGNGLDDDCNGQVDDGFEDLGTLCEAGQGGCKATGLYVCSADRLSLVCTATAGTPGPELCGNGIDDDCDGQTDEGSEALGTECVVGVGACQRSGVWVCSANRLTLQCSATPGTPGIETCNGIDDNCDGNVDELWPTKGLPCDGPDLDWCTEGQLVCNTEGTALVCSDNTGDNPELCDGIDNDCNPYTPDGSDEPLIEIPTACDSIYDSDTCKEGYYVCSGGGIQCSDPADDDLTNDAQNCGQCGNPCATYHTTSVSCQGSLCIPVCQYGWESCDSPSYNDGCEFERLTDAVCSSPINLGDVDGDDNGPGVTRYGYAETWFKVRMLENDLGDDNAVGIVTLTNPSDARFRACAYCDDCNGGAGTRYKCTTPPKDESGTIWLGRADDTFGDDDVTLLIHVSFYSGDSVGSPCGQWKLNVHGADNSLDCTCDLDHASGPDCD